MKKLRVKLGRFRGKLKLSQGHVVILGRSGSGKSNTARVLALELAKRGVPKLILDWASEYVELRGFSRRSPGDDFVLPVLPAHANEDPEHVDVVVDIFDAVFHLTHPQLYMLRVAVKKGLEAGARSIGGLLDALDEVPVRSYYDNETKAALFRRLSPLAEGRISRALSGDAKLSDVLSSNCIVDLGVFRSIYAKRFFSLLLLKALYDAAVARGIQEEIVHATLIEEAWNVIPYRRLDVEPTIGERLFAELRKFGECLVAVAQNPSEIAWSIVNNAEVLIIHSMLPREYEILGLKDFASSALERGEALIVARGRVKFVRIRRALSS